MQVLADGGVYGLLCLWVRKRNLVCCFSDDFMDVFLCSWVDVSEA